MLSRVADTIYWMNRYMERAENVARFIDVSLQLTLDAPDTRDPWGALIAATGDDAGFHQRYGTPTQDSVIRFLTFDREYRSSIVSCLAQARENARTVREIVSSELWEHVNTSYLMVKDAHLDAVMDAPHDFFAEIKKASHLFVGISYLTMTHNEGWHFGRLGRLLERADKTSRIVDVKYFILLPDVSDVGSTYDEVQWAALLKSASAFEMYRKRHGHIVPGKVVDFLLFDRKFPRSVSYCLRKADRSLHAITGSPTDTFDTEAERALGRLSADFEFVSGKEVLARGVHEFLDVFQTRLNSVGDAIYDTFFALIPNEDEARSVRF
jgi:uncharacterized alpha-E superfamily protein